MISQQVGWVLNTEHFVQGATVVDDFPLIAIALTGFGGDESHDPSCRSSRRFARR